MSRSNEVLERMQLATGHCDLGIQCECIRNGLRLDSAKQTAEVVQPTMQDRKGMVVQT